jgi:hypothetical protein
VPVTESQRHQLYESLRVHLGESNAETFMNLMPPNDWSDLATTSDIARLSGRIDALDERLSGRIDALTGRIDAVEGQMATKTDVAEVLQVIAESKAETLRTFGTWLFASQAAVIASVTFVIAIGR